MAHSSLGSLFTDIANAIRNKTGTTGSIVADNFPSKITDVYNKGNSDGQATGKTNYEPMQATLSNAGALSVKNAAGTQRFSKTFGNSYDAGVSATKKGNAEVGHVLSGKTFTNSSSVNATGTMPNNGATGATINPGGSYTIPAGYTSGGTVKANPNQNSGTYNATSRSNSIDMGANNTYRYVKTSGVPNSNSDTYTFPVEGGATKDLGSTNTYRYVNAENVYAKGSSDGYSSGYNQGVSDADNRLNRNSVSYTSGVNEADARANPSSTNYQSGYNAGFSAGRSIKSQVIWKDFNFGSGQTYDLVYTFNEISSIVGIAQIACNQDRNAIRSWSYEISGNKVTFHLENISGSTATGSMGVNVRGY